MSKSTETTEPKADPADSPAPTAKGSAKAVTVIEAIVEITRNEVTKIAATVYEHEIRILQALHGEDRVKTIETYEVEVSGFNPRDEFKRLQRRYNNKQSGDVVAKAYPLGEFQLADELGISLGKEAKATAKNASQNEGTVRRTKR